jgi:hypothetical protein
MVLEDSCGEHVGRESGWGSRLLFKNFKVCKRFYKVGFSVDLRR